jgi:hypothetical protein
MKVEKNKNHATIATYCRNLMILEFIFFSKSGVFGPFCSQVAKFWHKKKCRSM